MHLVAVKRSLLVCRKTGPAASDYQLINTVYPSHDFTISNFQIEDGLIYVSAAGSGLTESAQLTEDAVPFALLRIHFPEADFRVSMSVSIAMIAESQCPGISEITAWLQTEAGRTADHIWPDIPAAERAGLGTQLRPDLTIVLQSWSDQYPPEHVDRLIGATLYSGLLCCYGVWCESDGRSRQTWPHSTRVPLDHARTAVEREIHRIQAQRAVLPRTAARDEVFLHRNGDFGTVAGRETAKTAIVVSPDRVLRDTWTAVLRFQGIRTSGIPLKVTESVAGRPADVVLHDLDPDSSMIAESVEQCRSAFRSALFVGMASMPCHISADGDNRRFEELTVLPKIDPMSGAERLISLLHDSNEKLS